MTRTLDAGPIILQSAVPIRDDDTAESLSERILAEEHRIYSEAVRIVLEGRFRIEGRRVLISPTQCKLAKANVAKNAAKTCLNRFKPVDEQLAYMRKGAAEIIPED